MKQGGKRKLVIPRKRSVFAEFKVKPFYCLEKYINLLIVVTEQCDTAVLRLKHAPDSIVRIQNLL